MMNFMVLGSAVHGFVKHYYQLQKTVYVHVSRSYLQLRFVDIR